MHYFLFETFYLIEKKNSPITHSNPGIFIYKLEIIIKIYITALGRIVSKVQVFFFAFGYFFFLLVQPILTFGVLVYFCFLYNDQPEILSNQKISIFAMTQEKRSLIGNIMKLYSSLLIIPFQKI